MKNRQALDNFIAALLEFNSSKAEAILMDAIEQKDNLLALDYFIVEALKIIGIQGEIGELSLSEIYLVGNICDDLVTKIAPIKEQHLSLSPRIGITTLGDYHLLGKKMVLTILHQSGFNLIDYGHGMGINSIVAKVIRDDLDILLISTLMKLSALMISEVQKKITKIKPNLKILVGGTPFNEDCNLYKTVGADAMGASPFEAVEILKEWTKIYK